MEWGYMLPPALKYPCCSSYQAFGKTKRWPEDFRVVSLRLASIPQLWDIPPYSREPPAQTSCPNEDANNGLPSLGEWPDVFGEREDLSGSHDACERPGGVHHTHA